MSKIPDLKSSVAQRGKIVTEIIHFIGGEKRTIAHIKTDTIVQGQFTKFDLQDGSMIMINDKNVLLVEVFKEE